MRIVFFLLMCIGLCCGLQSNGVAEERTLLQSIDFKAKTGSAETVTFTFEGTSSRKIFMLSGEKPRLVIDFLETAYRGGSKIAVEKGSLVQGIRVGSHKKPQMKTRVVIDLIRDQKVAWKEKQGSDSLTIELNSAGEAPPVKKAAVQAVVAPKPVQPEKKPVVQQPEVVEKTEPEIKIPQKDVAVKKKDPFSAPKTLQQPVTEVVEVEEEKAPVVTEPAKKPEKKVQKVVKANPGVPSLLDVSFENSKEKGEMILFKLDDFHPPVVSAIEKGIPRIVCDFYNMRMDGGIKNSIDVDGKYVEKIRVARHENPGKVRAVLDLAPGNDYDLQQVFFNEDNLFVLIVNILGGNTAAPKTQ